MRITPTTELEHRCSRLQARMAGTGLDAVIIIQNADLFYFTGTIQSGCLYVPVSGQPLYMVRRDAGRARMESGLKEVVPFSSMKRKDLLPVITLMLSAVSWFSPDHNVGCEIDVNSGP